MYVYNLHWETGLDGKPFPVLAVEGEQPRVKIERSGSDRLTKFPLYSFNEEKNQEFIVRWTYELLDEEDKDDFIEIFGNLAPHFMVLGASIDEGNPKLINISGIASCSEEEFLEFFIE